MFAPITHDDGTKYSVVIPETIVVTESLGMPDIEFKDSDGDRVKVILHKRDALDLRDQLVKALDVGSPT